MEDAMPVTMFLGLMLLTIGAAAATIALAVYAQVPLVAIGFAAVVGSLLLGLRQWR
jgi:hypothetical protein